MVRMLMALLAKMRKQPNLCKNTNKKIAKRKILEKIKNNLMAMENISIFAI